MADVEGAKPDVFFDLTVLRYILAPKMNAVVSMYAAASSQIGLRSPRSSWRSQIEEERWDVRLFVKLRGVQVVTVALQILMFLGREKERGQRGSVVSYLP